MLEIYTSPEMRQVFNQFKKVDLDSLPSSLFVEKIGPANEVVSRFEIHFFENRIVTYFKNESHILKISQVLSREQSPFGQEFAHDVCPLMGFKSDDILKELRNLYIGRCAMGLGKSIKVHGYQTKAHLTEFIRITNLIKRIEPAVYSSPIL